MWSGNVSSPVEGSPWRNGQGALGDKEKQHRVPVQQELRAEKGKWKFIMKTQGDVRLVPSEWQTQLVLPRGEEHRLGLDGQDLDADVDRMKQNTLNLSVQTPGPHLGLCCPVSSRQLMQLLHI